MTQPIQPFAKDFFVYEADVAALVAGATTTVSFVIQADSAFMLQKMSLHADVAGAAQDLDSMTIPLCTIQITDTGSGRNLFNQPVPVSAVFGYPGQPFILPIPKEFAPNATVALTFTNYSDSTDYNLRASFIGTKLFYR